MSDEFLFGPRPVRTMCRRCGTPILDGQIYTNDGSWKVHVDCPIKPVGAICKRCNETILQGDEATTSGMHVRCPSITNKGPWG